MSDDILGTSCVTNAEARFNKSLRPRKPESSLGRTAQDVHLDSHTAPELCLLYQYVQLSGNTCIGKLTTRATRQTGKIRAQQNWIRLLSASHKACSKLSKKVLHDYIWNTAAKTKTNTNTKNTVIRLRHNRDNKHPATLLSEYFWDRLCW